MLNTALPAPVQAAPPVQASSPVQPRPPAQAQTLFQAPPPLLQNTPAILPQPTAAAATAPAPTPKPVDTPPQITLQPASFTFSPGIVSCCCPHPGLIRDGWSLGPRVELMRGGKRWRTRPLNRALFQHISRNGLPLKPSPCSCQPVHPRQEQTTSAKRAGQILQNLSHWTGLGGWDDVWGLQTCELSLRWS